MQKQNNTFKKENGSEVILSIENLTEPVSWEQYFGRTGLLHIEIGVGRDTFLMDLAQENPDFLCLGIDYSRERVRRVAGKIVRSGISSIRLLCCEAAQGIYRFIPPQSVEAAYLFFPDPWPKKKHHKNRFLNPASARLLATKIIPGGRFHLKTDDRDLFLHMRSVLEKTSFFRNPFGPGQRADNNSFTPHMTLYEKKWIKYGKEIYSLMYNRTVYP